MSGLRRQDGYSGTRRQSGNYCESHTGILQKSSMSKEDGGWGRWEGLEDTDL